MPKGAGDKITCVVCDGRGYVLRGLTGDYPVECSRCRGTGVITIAPRPGSLSVAGVPLEPQDRQPDKLSEGTA